jgi:hypothetical protein
MSSGALRSVVRLPPQTERRAAAVTIALEVDIFSAWRLPAEDLAAEAAVEETGTRRVVKIPNAMHLSLVSSQELTFVARLPTRRFPVTIRGV